MTLRAWGYRGPGLRVWGLGSQGLDNGNAGGDNAGAVSRPRFYYRDDYMLTIETILRPIETAIC